LSDFNNHAYNRFIEKLKVSEFYSDLYEMKTWLIRPGCCRPERYPVTWKIRDLARKVPASEGRWSNSGEAG
jgi:hypothetical protein